MVILSLAVNVAILLPVLWGLLSGGTGSDDAFGPDSPARRILVCVYLGIAAISAVLLAWPAGRTMLVPGLLTMQVAYKVATVAALGLWHPVAATNLAIAALHGMTLWTLARGA